MLRDVTFTVAACFMPSGQCTRTISMYSNAVVTCEIKLSPSSLHTRPSEIILFRRVETCLKLFQKIFTGLLQLVNIFQRIHCRRNNFEIILEFLQWLK